MLLKDQWDSVFNSIGIDGMDAEFRHRVLMGALASAVNIGNEAVNTPDHANRVLLAKAVTNNPILWMESFALVLASQNLDNSSTDAQITNSLASVWNTMAGAV